MAKVVVIGLDGATFDLLMPWIRAGELPVLRRLMDHSLYGYLISALPALTPVAWSSFMTGMNPGKHGILGFTALRRDGRPSVISSRDRRGEEIWVIFVPDMEKFIEYAEEHGFSLTTDYLAEYMRKIVRSFNAAQPIYKRIARFIIREDEFPKTTTRKVRRKEVLREAGLEEDISYHV